MKELLPLVPGIGAIIALLELPVVILNCHVYAQREHYEPAVFHVNSFSEQVLQAPRGGRLIVRDWWAHGHIGEDEEEMSAIDFKSSGRRVAGCIGTNLNVIINRNIEDKTVTINKRSIRVLDAESYLFDGYLWHCIKKTISSFLPLFVGIAIFTPQILKNLRRNFIAWKYRLYFRRVRKNAAQNIPSPGFNHTSKPWNEGRRRNGGRRR